MLAGPRSLAFGMAPVMNGVDAVIKPAENHFTRCGLQDASDRNIDGAGNHFLRVVHHHHGAVVQVSDTLVVLLAFFQNKDAHDLARKYNGFERIGKLVDVQDFNAVKLRDFVQIEIVGDDFAVVDFGQLDEFHVDFMNIGEVVFEDLDIELGHFLDALENVEAAAAAIAFERIGGVGHQLELAEHELGDDQGAIQEPGFDDVGDAAVDDDAGVEDLEGLAGSLFATEQ